MASVPFKPEFLNATRSEEYPPGGMQPGTVVAGRYELVARLGGGGMGEVFRAVHTMSRREVAVKVIPAERGHSAAAATRFQREASAPAAIGHPAIVNVFDAGVDLETGAFFIVMELLEGTSLRERMGPDAVPYIAAILEPLAAAHAKGFVHRDLKPENVFLQRSGGVERVRLLDFGLARRMDDLGVTAAGTTMGTPDYMAPEQWMSARDAGPTADVFAIGGMLYEAIAGRRPFVAQSPAAQLVLMQTMAPVPLTTIVPGVPHALSALIDRCLALDPTQRPRDAGELSRELTRVLSHSHAPSAFAATLPPTPSPAVFTTPVASFPHTHAPGPMPTTFASAEVARTPPVPARRGCLFAAIAVLVLGIAVAGGAAVLVFVLRDRPVSPPPGPHREPVVVPSVPERASDLTEVAGNGFAISVPREYQSVPFTLHEAVLQYREPSPGSVPRQLLVSSYPFDQSLDAATAQCLSVPRENGGAIDYDVVAEMGGQPAREVRWAVQHPQGSYRQRQRVTLREGRAWLLTCVGPAENFEPYHAICTRVFDSFRFQ